MAFSLVLTKRTCFVFLCSFTANTFYFPHNSATAGDPGPGAYDPPSSIGKGQKSSLSARYKDPSDRHENPGPGAYDVVKSTGKDAPQFSMTARAKRSKAADAGPGPGAYDQKSDLLKTRDGAITMKGRAKDPSANAANPGPGAYNPSKPLGHGAPKYSLGGRYEQKDETQKVPGPGAYDIPTPKGLATSLGFRNAGAGASDYVPGPGAYTVSAGTGKGAPRYSMLGRTKTPNSNKSNPGPGAYDQRSSFNAKKGFSLGARHYLADSSQQVPGPGAYNANLGKGAPSFSLSFRFKPAGSSHVVPGPGAYDMPAPKVKGPMLKGRTKDPTSNANNPGPGAYNPKLSRNTPAFSMRQKAGGTEFASSSNPIPAVKGSYD